MFFENLSDIPRLAKSAHATIFTVEPETSIDLPHAIEIRPQADKQGITIDQIREIVEHSNTKQSAAQFVIIRYAETLNPNAANAFLKLLEEPKTNYHYILLTSEPHALLPTILSRAFLFTPRIIKPLEQKPPVDDDTLSLAKRLLASTPEQLPALADEIAKIKPDARKKALLITSTAIELAYKSYFSTKNPRFLQKIPKLLELHQNLKANGLLKLHIVADLC